MKNTASSLMTANDFDLSKLKIKDLNNLLHHVKLGEAYLLKKLKSDEYETLIQLAYVKEEKIHSLKSDAQEQISKAYLMLMTIVTSCLGGWLGFAEFLKYSIHGFFSIVIICLTVLGGWFVGYLSYRLAKQNGKAAVTTLRLNHLQAKLLTLLIEKKQKQLKKSAAKIAALMQHCTKQELQLDEGKISFSQEQMANDFSFLTELPVLSFIKKLPDEKIQNYYLPRITKLTTSLKKHAATIMEHQLKDKDKSQASFGQKNLAGISSFETLLQPPPHRGAHYFALQTWLQNNFLDILIGLLTTLLGGFASLFVFVNGIPALCRKFDFMQHIPPTTLHYLRAAGLGFVIVLTLFFGYTFFYTRYKMYKREREVEKSENLLIQKEQLINEHMNKHHSYSSMHQELRQLDDLLQAIDFLQPENLSKLREMQA